jgi:heterodisulfide reductase subunit A2
MNGTQKHVIVIGAGIAGMETAYQLSAFGHKVTLIEKDDKIGGHLNRWNHLFPNNADPRQIIEEIGKNIGIKNVRTITGTEITGIVKTSSHLVISAGNEMKMKADAVVVSTGFNLFDATRKEEYGYGLFENVITSADLEDRLKNGGQVLTSTGTAPKRIAIIHCVGSRDEKSGNTYCSKVCCITGIKQALEINKLLPDCEVFCFYMDLRLYGSTFDSLYLEAQRKNKIQFIRGRLSEAAEKHDKKLQIKAEDTLSGRPLRMEVDMIVLLAGMEANKAHHDFCENEVMQTDANGFFKSKNVQTARNETQHPGLFLAGTCVCPMSVNETIENARSASVAVNNYLTEVKS